jgi:hypothetical protein
MAFTINQTGIEDYATGTTQVVFDSPVIVQERDAETGADAVHDVAISGVPVVVVFSRTQAKSFLRIYARMVKGTDLDNLRTLLASGEPVKVKLTPGSAATVTCMFGPRSEQVLVPWNGDHPDAQGDGSALDPVLIQYKAELFLLRLA